MSDNNMNQLYHHGIPGMKWGIRRYQNKDGSLTPAGRKRAAKLEKQYNKVTGRKFNNQNNVQKQNVVKRKNVKEMSDDDLIQETRRINLENNYRSAQIRKQQLNPTKVSKGKAFIKKVGKNVIAAAATEASKNVLRKFIEDSVADAIVKKKNTKIIKKQVIKNDLGTITIKKMKVK